MLDRLVDALSFHLACRSWTLRQRLNFTMQRDVGPRTLQLPVEAGRGLDWLVEDYEPWMPKFLSWAFARRPGAFIDCGANEGQSLLAMLAADPARQYLGFEPLPEEYAHVSAIIRRNKLTNCRLLPCALGEKDGIAEFQVAFERAASTIVPIREGRVEATMTVFVRCGDAVLAECGIARVATIKIDVEGAELAVLRGFAGRLAKDRPVVMFEMLPLYDAQKRRDSRAIAAFCAGQGYELRRIEPDGTLVPVQRPGVDVEIGKPAPPEAFRQVNYAAVPREL